MANDIKTLTYIATESLRQFKNNCQFVTHLDGENFTSKFTDMPKKGETFTIRKQAMYGGRTGEVYNAEAYNERTVSVSVQETMGVDITLTQRELMFSLDKLQERVIAPAALKLANMVDSKAIELATLSVANAVGAPGTVPTALKTYNQARAKQKWNACPDDGHTLLISPDMSVEAVDAGKTFFNPSQLISDEMSRGKMGRHYNANVFEVENLYVDTVGPLGGTPLVKTTVASGTTPITQVVTKGWSNAASNRLKAGNVVTFASCYACHPISKKSTGALMQFVLTENADSASNGEATLKIKAADGNGIIASGPYQNVVGVPTAEDSVALLATANKTGPVGIRFQRDAFIFGTISQPEPGGVEFVKSISDEQTGLSIRFLRDWDTVNNKQLNRLDVVWAFGVAFPEWACRIQS